MTTESQNPMIQALAEHFARGDKPVNIFGDQPGRPQGIAVMLEDGTFISHEIAAKDDREFFDWYVEAHKWLILHLPQHP